MKTEFRRIIRYNMKILILTMRLYMEKEKEKLNFDDLFSHVKKKENKWHFMKKTEFVFEFSTNPIYNSVSVCLEADYAKFLKDKVKEKDIINNLGISCRLLMLIEIAIVISSIVMMFESNMMELLFPIIACSLLFMLTRYIKSKIKLSFNNKVLELRKSIDKFFHTYGGASKGDIECYDYGLKVKTEKEKVECFDDWIKVNKNLYFLS